MRKYKKITYDERKKIEQLYNNGLSPADIAMEIGVHISTMYRELGKGGDGTLDCNARCKYSADLAESKAAQSLKCRGRRSEAAKDQRAAM